MNKHGSNNTKNYTKSRTKKIRENRADEHITVTGQPQELYTITERQVEEAI